jgi:hypothetical protein
MCKNIHMATNLALDDKLIEDVKRRKQLRILDAFGTFEFDPAYDYKAERRRVKSKARS